MECPADWIDCGLQVGPTSPIADRWTISPPFQKNGCLCRTSISAFDVGALTEVVGKSEHNTPRAFRLRPAGCEVFRVPYSVHFAAEIDVPADLLLRALEVLLEIAASMEGISPTSAFWSEAHSANAELTLEGWRFEYRIHHRDRRILVVGARQLSPQARSS